MFKFIHAADIHLDSPLRGLDCYEGAPVEAIRGAARAAFANMIALALDERVDLVVLAGDLYDGEWHDYNTGLFFIKHVRELEKHGIRVVMLSGNHDAASRITAQAQLTLPANVHVLPTKDPGTKKYDELRVAVHGQGFATQKATLNLAAGYLAPVPGYFNIGVLHTSLEGREGHDTYAPCTLAELEARGYDYWALGHIHQRESVNGDRHPRIEYPGNIQGRHIRELGAKGCLIVTVDPSGRVETEFRPLDVFRWFVVEVDATDADSVADAKDRAIAALEETRSQADGRPFAARIVVACRDGLHREIAARLEQFRADLAGRAGDGVWIEKIKLNAIAEQVPTELNLSDDATAELAEVLAGLRSDAEAAKKIFESGDCGKLQNLLPTEIKDLFEKSFEHYRDEIFDRAASLLRSTTDPEAP